VSKVGIIFRLAKYLSINFRNAFFDAEHADFTKLGTKMIN
jgi:hypothetical protein